ncbi:MAG: HAD-IA family hydrolase [Candidatus Endonucleobacter bathymodioli]|uniref:HAD-IA family hydrolase n=1 Tax=Candidatus Endonucleibacter bathymodioli TaxID=539814 RepID=A0AA90NSS1_9GAMM|nr:HAD-IA family hydrolase [Candidatus Endonucleobacter bathymodioli]
MPKRKPISGVFFDLDGTLLDTADDFIFAVNHLLQDYNKPPKDCDIIRKHVSAGSRTLTAMAFNLDPDHPDIEPARQQLLSHYEKYINDLQRPSPAAIYPGIQTLLNELEQRDIPWGIVTNKPEVYTTPLLKQTKLYSRAKAIICPEHVTQPKPDPEALLLACIQANCSPNTSIYIGDHKRDIDAGKMAGMTTVAALYGYINDDDNPRNWQADFLAESVRDIHQWLASQNWTTPP